MLRLELETARKYGLTPKQYWELEETEQEYMLALETLEAEEKANTCPICGGNINECQNPDNRFSYDISHPRCYRQEALIMDAQAYSGDKYAGTISPRIRLNPEKVQRRKRMRERRKKKG